MAGAGAHTAPNPTVMARAGLRPAPLTFRCMSCAMTLPTSELLSVRPWKYKEPLGEHSHTSCQDVPPDPLES